MAASGFTETVLSPYDERQLLDVGVGITNLVRTATRSAAEVTSDDLRRGVVSLKRKVRRWHPRAVAILGLDAYRTGFNIRTATVGRQPEGIDGAQLWVVPNPSGIQAYYPFDRLVAELRALRDAVDAEERRLKTRHGPAPSGHSQSMIIARVARARRRHVARPARR